MKLYKKLQPHARWPGYSAATLQDLREAAAEMGGGGTYMCEPCAKVLRCRMLSREFRLAREELGI